MIKRFKVVNLNKIISCDLKFNPDINIITGRNGSGKTTVLKLLWYAISGNLERILPEMSFDLFELETDKLSLHISISEESKRNFLTIRYGIDGDVKEVKRPIEKPLDSPFEMVNRAIYTKTGSSIFFPTFRRIEGGFSLNNQTNDFYANNIHLDSGRRYYISGNNRNELQEAMSGLSERLSVGQHRFVASISTNDINQLLTTKYAEISEQTNRLHMQLSIYILTHIQNPSLNIIDTKENPTSPTSPTALESLEDIRRRAGTVSKESEALLRPFSVLNELMAQVFQHKGIKIAGPVTLGDAKNAIASDKLSAGEKQMLSFLCYNAFSHNSCIFIDEPETSLHVDWQRILFTVLLQQSTDNQFIVATHSPFIYSKYADKELVLSKDEGQADADN